MSEKRILGFFQNFGIEVSATYISSNGRAVIIFFIRKKATFTAVALPQATMSKSITPLRASTAPTSIAKLSVVRCLPPISPRRRKTA